METENLATGGDLVRDVRVVAAGRWSIPASSAVLAAASPVFESMLHRPMKGRSTIAIRGVPFEAVQAFVRVLHSSSGIGVRKLMVEEELKKYGVQMLVLSHAYRIGWLKRAAEAALAAHVTAETVVDTLHVARLCDASRLYLRCMSLIANHSAAVERSDGWRFLQANDPRLELDILQFLHDSEFRTKRRRRKKEEQKVYKELNQAMDCLLHICTEGCTDIGPLHNRGSVTAVGSPAIKMMTATKKKSPCPNFQTCLGIQLLIRHFTSCPRKRACLRCRRMLQLFHLHSSLCDGDRDEEPSCKVPLCEELRLKKHELADDVWVGLVRKVVAARTMSTLSKRVVPRRIWIQSK